MKFLIVDDSLFFRRALNKTILSIDPNFEVATANSGKIALMKIPQLKPDFIFLDQNMPEIDGLETLRRIKKTNPEITVVMVSGIEQNVSQVTMEALSLGAFDFIPKLNGKTQADNERILKLQIEKVLSAHRQKPSSPPSDSSSTPSPSLPPRKKVDKDFSLIAIGVSTGGPKALEEVIPNLSPNIGCPVLIVQHMPAKFTASLAQHLNERSMIQVVEGAHGQPLEDNNVYIAPGDFHMHLQERDNQLSICLNQKEPVNACRPSVDVLFQSLAEVVNKPVLSCILTGMGKDGFNGVRALKKQNTYTIAQSKETCVVYGMPKIVIESNLSDEVLPLDLIAPRMNQLLEK